MHPELTRGFPAFILAAVAVGTAVHVSLLYRERVPIRRVLFVFGLLVLSALVGAKAFSWWNDGPSIAMRLDAGLRYPGGAFGAIFAVVAFRRLLPAGFSAWRWADLLVPGTGFAMAVIRVDCFLSGCCGGRICNLPWALRFPRGSGVWQEQLAAGLIPFEAVLSREVHPLQVYLLIWSLFIGWLALRWARMRWPQGQAALAALALHELGKFGLEFLRFPAEPGVQLASLGVAVALGVMWFCRRRRLGSSEGLASALGSGSYG